MLEDTHSLDAAHLSLTTNWLNLHLRCKQRIAIASIISNELQWFWLFFFPQDAHVTIIMSNGDIPDVVFISLHT